MPKTLTESAATWPVQTAPTPGDPRTAGSVETPFQAAADRAAWLKDRILYLDPDRHGVRRMRECTIGIGVGEFDYASLSHGDLAYDPLFGIWRWDAYSELTTDALIRTASGQGAGVPGRWIHEAALARGRTNGGLAQLNASGVVPAAQLPSPLVKYGYVNTADAFVPNVPTRMPAFDVVLGAVAAGDVVVWHFTGRGYNAAISNSNTLYFFDNYGGAWLYVSDAPSNTWTGDANVNLAIHFIREVTVARSSYSGSLGGVRSGGGVDYAQINGLLSAQVFRRGGFGA